MAIITLGAVSFQVAVLLLLLRIAEQKRFSWSFIVMGEGFLYLGSALAIFVVNEFVKYGNLEPDWDIVALLLFFVLLLLILAVSFLNGKRFSDVVEFVNSTTHQIDAHGLPEGAALLLTSRDANIDPEIVASVMPIKEIIPIESKAKVAAQAYGLTERETDVLLLVVQKYSRRQIREMLNVSDGTISTHSANIYRKFGVHNRNDLIALVGGHAQSAQDA